MSPKKGDKSELTRREMLKLTTGGTALAGLAGLPSAVRDAVAVEGASGTGQVVNLLRDQRGATISRELFGYLIEHYGRTVDAVWVGEKSSIPNDRGLRLDTIKAFRRLGPTLVRYPGGTFADEYRWQDGIGPRAQRPVRRNIFFGGEEDNQFGTDEFLRFCELVEATAAIKVNPFTRALDDTLLWMEYCNYVGNTTLAKLRAKNGHPKPYGVKYWQLGNENNDAYSPEVYAEIVHMWTFHMRQADAQAQIVVTGGGPDWNERFLTKFVDLVKHGGFASGSKMIHIAALKYANEQGIRGTVGLCDKYLGPHPVDVAVEEWAAGGGQSFLPQPPVQGPAFPMGYPPFRAFESHVSMTQALSAAGSLHMFMRNAKRMKFASFLYPTNTWGAMVRTEGPRFHLTPNYHVFDLLKGHKDGDLVGMELDPAGGLDAVASASKDGRQTTVSLINKQKGESVEARLRLNGGGGGLPSKAAAMVLAGKPEDENSFEEPNKVKPRAGKVEGKGSEWSVVCEPFSLTVVTFEHAG